MAAFGGKAATASIALTGGAAKTVLQLVAPANHRVKIISWGVYFDGTSPTAQPAQVRFLRQTTAGTMSALTPVKLDNAIGDSLLSTAQHTATVEPTAGDVLEIKEVHPQMGYEKIYPYGAEPIIDGSGRIGIECNAPANVNVRAEIQFEE